MGRRTAADRRAFGAAGEDFAARHLESLGWRIIERNARAGPHGELDIVARDGDEIVIVEVRSRTVGVVQPAETSVGPVKLRRLIKAARRYVADLRWQGNWRIDLAAVTADPLDPSGEPSIELFPDITMGMDAGLM